MKTLLPILAALFLLPSAHAEGKKALEYLCTTPKMKEIKSVATYSIDDGDSYTLEIQWAQPVNGQTVLSGAADSMSDFTVEYFDAPDIKARLMFYTKDDPNGKRTVLELNGVETPARCKWINK